MRAEVLLALNRGLASCWSVGNASFQRSLSCLAHELLLVTGPEVAGVALVSVAEDGRLVVGKARDGAQLPDENLGWLAEEGKRSGRACIVKDHTLEPARCGIGVSALRSSVVAHVSARLLRVTQQGVQIWFGIEEVVTSRLYEKLQRVAEAFREWLDSVAGTFDALVAYQDPRGELERYRREVLTVAHDLRAPLGALRYRKALTTDLGHDDGCSQEDLAYIEQLVARLAPRTTTEIAHSNQSRCRVNDVVLRVVKRFRNGAAGEGMRLSARGSCKAGSVALIAEIDLERVLTNLVGNALRHSQGSGVVVEVSSGDEGISVSVRDNGAGFPEDVVRRFNSKDCRGTLSSASSSAGWGVGLLSSKERIEAAGGSMTIVSSLGADSVVSMLLPAASGSESQIAIVAETPTPYSEVPQQLVLIDDDQEHNASLSRVLHQHGIAVRSFSSLTAAVAEISHTAVGPIVCDINMPDGGAEALLSKFDAERSAASIAIISGESDEARLYRLAASGAQAFFCKPIEIEQLVAWVRSRQH